MPITNQCLSLEIKVSQEYPINEDVDIDDMEDDGGNSILINRIFRTNNTACRSSLHS